MTRRFAVALFVLVAAVRVVRAEDAPGAIAGRVRFAGDVPPPRDLAVHHDHQVCGKLPIRDESILVGAEGALANAVVVLQGAPVEAVPVATTRATLDQRGCAFVPHVQSVTLGTTLAIQSSDPVLHNVHAFRGKRTAFNIAMPLPGKVVERRLDQAGILRVRCDSGHSWMSAFIAVVEHRFHATTGADGTFKIERVPPGRYTLRAWHERLGAIEQTVEVTAGQDAPASLTFRDTIDPKETAATTVERQARGDEALLREALQATRGELAALEERRRADERARLGREGEQLFGSYCATCHGRRGDGKGTSAQFTTSPPRDLTRGSFKFRMSPSGSPPSLADLVRTISVGVRGTHMPGWRGRLTRSQIETLARYVTSLSDVFWTDAPPPPPLVIPPEPPYDNASVVRGKAIYARMQCATCHGPGGDGDGPAAKTLRDDWSHPIRPAVFTQGAFKGGCCAASIYRAISTGLGGTPMPGFGAAMSEAERWDLAHYVLSLGRKQPLVDYLRAPAGRITVP